MSKETITNLHAAIDMLADEIGDGTLIVELEDGRKFALISQGYLDTLETKADAYDQMTMSPEERAAEQAALLETMDAFHTSALHGAGKETS